MWQLFTKNSTTAAALQFTGIAFIYYKLMLLYFLERDGAIFQLLFTVAFFFLSKFELNRYKAALKKEEEEAKAEPVKA